MRILPLLVAAACALAPMAAVSKKDRDQDSGDPFSFGRNAKWIGLAGQPHNVVLAPDCPTPDPDDATARCVALSPAPGTTTFDERDLARIVLPGKSTNSFVCHLVSPIWHYQFNNTTGVAHPNAVIRITPYMTVENEVLNDPGLIDPRTGLPYGGKFEDGLPGALNESRSLAPGERHFRREVYTRACIAGILSRVNLREFDGLSDAQIDRFFKSETTLRLHMRGTVRLIDGASLLYGLRLMGD